MKMAKIWGIVATVLLSIMIVALGVGIGFSAKAGCMSSLLVIGIAMGTLLAILGFCIFDIRTQIPLKYCILAVIVIFLVPVFIFSMVHEDNWHYLVVHKSNEVRILNTAFLFPGTGWIEAICPITLETEASVQFGNIEATWRFEAKLDYKGGYNQTLDLVDRFKRKSAIVAELQRIFEQDVRAQLAMMFKPTDQFPKTFSFNFSDEAQEQFGILYYKAFHGGPGEKKQIQGSYLRIKILTQGT